MSLFQTRHFNKLAEIAVVIKLDKYQFDMLVDELQDTNPNFNATRFRNYVEERL